MFGFRLPPDEGSSKKIHQSPLSSSASSDESTESSSESNSDSESPSDAESVLTTDANQLQKTKLDTYASKSALYEDFMPEEENEDLKQQSASTDVGVKHSGQLLEDFTKHFANYLTSIQGPSPKPVEERVISKSKKEKSKTKNDELRTIKSDDLESQRHSILPKKPTNKELARLRRKADSLVKFSKQYNDKVLNFVKELNQ